MPVHIENMTSEVTAVAGDMPLSEAQLEALINCIIDRLTRRDGAANAMREAAQLRGSVAQLGPLVRDKPWA